MDDYFSFSFAIRCTFVVLVQNDPMGQPLRQSGSAVQPYKVRFFGFDIAVVILGVTEHFDLSIASDTNI